MPDDTRTNRPAVLTEANRDAHCRQACERGGDREYVLHVCPQVSLAVLVGIEQGRSLDRRGVQEYVDSVVRVVARGTTDQDVARTEDVVKVRTYTVTDALCLEEVIVEGAVDRLSVSAGTANAHNLLCSQGIRA